MREEEEEEEEKPTVFTLLATLPRQGSRTTFETIYQKRLP